MAFHFNASDDLVFQGLIGKSSLSQSNPLVEIKPSSLDLTANCWATSDIVQIESDLGEDDEFLNFRTLSNDFGEALPSGSSNSSFFSKYEYLLALEQLPTFTLVLNRTLEYCTSSGLLQAPTEQTNFTRNCSATGNFWWHFVYSDDSKEPITESVASLFQVSLPLPFNTMSNSTLRKIALDALNTAQQRHGDVLRPPFQQMLEEAAKSCASKACLMLEYGGNPDIAGIGVISKASVSVCGFEG